MRGRGREPLIPATQMAISMNADEPEASFLRPALAKAIEQGASDLHVVVGHRPTIRVHGRLQQLAGPVLTDEVARAALKAISPPDAWQRFEREHNADFALELDFGSGPRRLRVNYFVSSQNCGACFRIIPSTIPDFHWAGFPLPLAQRLTHFRNGLVLVSGVSGAGKNYYAGHADQAARPGGRLSDHHARRADRIRLSPRRAVDRDAARGRARRRLVRRGTEIRTATRSRRDPGRRDPRSRHGPDGAECGGDGPPGVRHAAHPRRQGGPHPLRRSRPGKRAGRTARAAGDESARGDLPAPVAERSGRESASWRSKFFSTIRRSPAPSARAKTKASTASSSPAGPKGCCRWTSPCGSCSSPTRSAAKRPSNTSRTKVCSTGDCSHLSPPGAAGTVLRISEFAPPERAARVSLSGWAWPATRS